MRQSVEEDGLGFIKQYSKLVDDYQSTLHKPALLHRIMPSLVVDGSRRINQSVDLSRAPLKSKFAFEPGNSIRVDSSVFVGKDSSSRLLEPKILNSLQLNQKSSIMKIE